MALAQGPFFGFWIFVILCLISSYICETENQGIEESNGFFFCRNEKNNKLIFENWNRSMERVAIKIKRTRDGFIFKNTYRSSSEEVRFRLTGAE